ncbi:S9 family peptidase [Arachidicoccus terrestris]|uniref:S9 family peptidase n=1 Tax=Arachidicoccus terrestris TaxID=2875539 RepID=UPI001CC3B935|nr:S9 family peptidase [Arachidicoccus terrestris]UAY56400.1 S9 family peptidase [Arachidicoccus terrestris]
MLKPILAILLLGSLVANGQQAQSSLTDQDYSKAASFLGPNLSKYIDRSFVRPNWIDGSDFWYRVLTEKGSEYVLVEAKEGKRRPAFDQEKLAQALSKQTGAAIDGDNLPFRQIHFSEDKKMLSFIYNGQDWRYDIKNSQLGSRAIPMLKGQNASRKVGQKEPGVLSPDKTKEAFIRDYNLWIRSRVDGRETQLTFDGIKDFGYSTDNAGWVHSDRAILAWSPDSKKIATYKQDQRNVNDMYLVSTNVGAPKLQSWKYELPGDTAIFKIHRCIVYVDQPKVVMLQVPADPRRSTLSDNISDRGRMNDVYWSEDGSRLAFVSTSRDHKIEKVRMADAATGAVREVFQETVPTQFESGWDAVNWRYLDKTKEIVWFSERDNYGHLYLYDATDGKLKNQITKGSYVVTELLKVDNKNRTLYFMACGLEKKNPYFAQLCSIKMDGSDFKVLTPETGNHTITLSPDGHYFVDAYSQPDIAPVTLLRSLDGKKTTPLEAANIERLKATGWQPVTPVTVKAADGKTDLYGLLYLPTHLDPNKKYPIIDYIYPGPQGGSVGSWSFTPSRGDHQSLAELGFIVLQLEGSSNPLRTKSFHDMSYGHMATNTLPDQIAAIRQLAAERPYIDTNEVGIWGHSGGGFATAAAMFKYPDFFKVGIAESGNHDNRNYEADWGERYNGLVSHSDYAAQANERYASQLKGKLLLVHGLMDDNVPPSNTMLVVEALEKAGKDFDLIVFPNSRHGYGVYSNYMMRRRWDYFVRNLAGKQPPKEFKIEYKRDPRN